MKKYVILSLFILTIIISFLYKEEIEVALDERSFLREHQVMTIGYMTGYLVDDIAFERELDILAYVSDDVKKRLDFDIRIISFDHKDQLIDAYTKGEIDCILSKDNYDLYNLDAVKSNVKTSRRMSVYGPVSENISAAYQINDKSFAYLDEIYLNDMLSYYNVLSINSKKFDDQQSMIEAYCNDEIVYMLLPDHGQFIRVGDKQLKRQFNLDDYSHIINMYYKAEFDLAVSYFNKTYKSKSYEWNSDVSDAFEIYYGRQFFLSGLEKESKQYLEDKRSINILVANHERPLVVKSSRDYYGILVLAMKYIEEVTSLEVNYYSIQELNDNHMSLNEIDFYTKRAYQNIVKNSGEMIETDSIIPSSLVVIGPVGNTEYATFWDLATGSIAVVDNDILVKSLQVMFPKIDVINCDTSKKAISLVSNNVTDFAILDAYEFQYHIINDDADGLKQLGYYNRQNDVTLLSSPNNQVLVDLINTSMNFMDSKSITDLAIKEILLYENNPMEYFALYGVILILIVTVIVSIVNNIKSRNEQIKLSYLSNHDSLTESLNLRGLRELINTNHQKLDYFLILIDIRKFKRVNIERGFEVGNQVIITFTKSLEELIASNGYCARNGGDEFVVLINKEFVNSSNHYIDQLYNECNKMIKIISGLPLSLDFGISNLNHEQTLTDVYSEAEGAINKRKEDSESGITYYTRELESKIIQERKLANEIVHAFDNEEFVLHYQPQFGSNSDLLYGLEALIRWQHPENGLMYPNLFLHIIHKENLIKQMDYYVLKKAIEQFKEWQDQGLKLNKLSINITLITLLDSDLLNKLNRFIQENDILASQICLEITEDFEIEDHLKLESVLVALKDNGYLIAMDDFGTGYSSLNYIVKYPIDIIKIDKSLVENITNRQQDLEFFTGIIDVLINLGMLVICEGVEEKEQLNIIKKFDGTIIQGYYYSKPIDKENVKKYLT